MRVSNIKHILCPPEDYEPRSGSEREAGTRTAAFELCNDRLPFGTREVRLRPPNGSTTEMAINRKAATNVQDMVDAASPSYPRI